MCTYVSTQELLDANIEFADLSQLQITAPTVGERRLSLPTLTWSERLGFAEYRLQIALNENFSNMIINKVVSGGNYILTNNDFTSISPIFGQTYYWKIATTFAKHPLTSQTGYFHLIDSTSIYVSQASQTNSEAGTRNSPYKKIQTGIDAIQSLRQSNAVTTANVLVAKGTYAETIILRPGISVRGSYMSDSWAADVSSRATFLNATTNTAVLALADITAAYTATTILEGMTISGGGITGVDNFAVELLNSNPLIRNNAIRGVCVAGVNIQSDSIYIVNGSPIIRDNALSGCQVLASDSTAIRVSSSGTPLIERNTISPGIGSTTKSGVTIYSASPIIINNIFLATASGSGTNQAIFQNGVSTTIISNNIINGGSAGVSNGILLSLASGLRVSNNIIFTSGGTTRYCIYESNAGDNLDSFENNVLFDCPTALYRDVSAPANLSTETQLNTPALTIGAGRPSQGNIALADDNVTLLTFALMNFTSATELKLTATSPVNVRCGGKNTNAATCGASANVSCGGVTSDSLQAIRTPSLTGSCTTPSLPRHGSAVGYSIGAYEID